MVILTIYYNIFIKMSR